MKQKQALKAGRPLPGVLPFSNPGPSRGLQIIKRFLANRFPAFCLVWFY